MIRLTTLFLSLLLYNVMAMAVPGFYENQQQGWHWYAATPVEEEEIEEKSPERHSENETTNLSENKEKEESFIIEIHAPADPKEELARLQETVETAKAQAVLDPTPENVKTYITLQNAIQQQALQFANTWQTVLWSNPELDVSLKKPTNQTARHVYLDQHQQDKAQAVQEWAKTQGLFYFFRSDCPYCQKFSPILKQFELTFGIQVVPISLDGGTLPEYPNAKPDNGAATRLGVTTVPAIYAVDPRTQNITPVSFGLISVDDLAERLWKLSTMPGAYHAN